MLDNQKEAIQKLIAGALAKLGAEDAPATLERPKDPTISPAPAPCSWPVA